MYCDASDIGLGTVLTQTHVEEKGEVVIAYLSAKLNDAQKKYTTTERECSAVLTAIERFRPYVEGVKFNVITDHASLLWLQSLRDPTGRLGRWALRLQQHDFTLIHRKGKHNIVPDALSRAVLIISISDYTDDTEFVGWRNKQKVSQRSTKLATINSTSLVVPAAKREDILRECHNSVLAGHAGIFKTTAKIAEKYW